MVQFVAILVVFDTKRLRLGSVLGSLFYILALIKKPDL